MKYDALVLSLTNTETLNYGAVLQACALQRFLTQEKCAVQNIDYCNKNKKDERALVYRLRSFVWQQMVRRVFEDKKRIQRTRQFIENYLSLTNEKYRSIEALQNSLLRAPRLIVGSDQVWNPNIVGKDPNWFLDFAAPGQRKIAYAASFGLSQLPEAYGDFCKSLLSKMDAISVREESGAAIVKELTGKSVKAVVDPVFLLPPEEWARLAAPPRQKGYVLCYYMPGFPAVEEKIKRLSRQYAREHGLAIIDIGKKEYRKLFFWEANQFGTGPAEFIGLFQNADFVVTNSFHGTAFSVIFQKNFISVVDTGIRQKTLSSRIVDLLTRIHLQDQILDVSSPRALCWKCDYKQARPLLQKEIKESKNYLRSAMEKKDETM